MLPLLLLLAITCLEVTGEARAELSLGRARVQAPVADLRKEPAPPGPTLEHDPAEESQLLYGDPVTVLEIQGEWARVAAPDQQEWTHNRRWEGYPGWMRLADLAPEPAGWSPNLVVVSKLAQIRGQRPTEPGYPPPGGWATEVPGARQGERPTEPDAPALLTLSLGTRLMGSEEADGWKVRLLDGSTGWIGGAEVRESGGPEEAGRARAQIVAAARLFLGDPYYWGGRSAHDPGIVGPPHAAVDCSGLVGLCYQAADVWVPRDAHEQWMKTRPISRENLQPADLVFLADPENALRITHVMLYAGDGKVIEGPGTGAAVREIPLEERLRETPGRRVHYGSCLSGAGESG